VDLLGMIIAAIIVGLIQGFFDMFSSGDYHDGGISGHGISGGGSFDDLIEIT
jgi:hypothetical protein